MPWEPDCYLKFKGERSQPFWDLAQLVDVRPGLSVVDLGCGTGALTAELAKALPDSNILGIDRSPEMLEKASKLSACTRGHTCMATYKHGRTSALPASPTQPPRSCAPA